MEAVKALTETISRLRPGKATLAELRAVEDVFQSVEQELQKMRRRLSAEEHTYDAIQARYAQMMDAAEDLERQITAAAMVCCPDLRPSLEPAKPLQAGRFFSMIPDPS
jgi:chromosome segregation ATPase